MSEFNRGDVIPGPRQMITITPSECVMVRRGDYWRCGRQDDEHSPRCHQAPIPVADLDKVRQAIRGAGCTAGVALCPATPVSAVSEVLADLDLVLCMTVNPGWGGQAFLPGSVAKLERLRALLGPGVALEVDGGIDASTAGRCASAGATAFVAGSAVFGTADPAAAVRAIADAAGAA